jgi:sulfur transfer complex TusBCD TusB component (DsrH family)
MLSTRNGTEVLMLILLLHNNIADLRSYIDNCPQESCHLVFMNHHLEEIKEIQKQFPSCHFYLLTQSIDVEGRNTQLSEVKLINYTTLVSLTSDIHPIITLQ